MNDFDTIYKTNRSYIESVALPFFNKYPRDADDLKAIVHYGAWLGWRSYKPESSKNLLSWMAQNARYELLHWQRNNAMGMIRIASNQFEHYKYKRRLPVIKSVPCYQLSDKYDSAGPDFAPDSIERIWLEAAINSLPARQREAMRMYRQEIFAKEGAKRMGIGISYFCKLRKQALLRLKEHLTGSGSVRLVQRSNPQNDYLPSENGAEFVRIPQAAAKAE